MKASENKLERFLGQTDTQFIIPVYQRNYDWKKQQCRQLLEDTLDIGRDDKRDAHFIGSIVYIHDDVYSSSGIRELTIIDGQQRITTAILVYIAIYALAQKSDDEALKLRINETYLINKFAQEEEKLKLKPTENNDKALKYLLRNDAHEVYSDYSQLIENYEYLQTRINLDNLEFLRKGLEKLMFVEISLERGRDNPQRIFESLNSTGLDLSQADLIRNYILMGLNQRKQLKIYSDYWKPIEEQTKAVKTNRNRVSDYIRDFLTIQTREVPNKNKVYEEFKAQYPVENFEIDKHVLQEMKKFAYYYHKLISPESEQDRDIREHIEFINRLEINVSYPFLLEVYNDYIEQRIDKHLFLEVLETIQSYVWRRFIVGLPTNVLNKIFVRLYADVDPSDYLASIQKSLLRRKGNQRFPTDSEVINMLREKDVYNIKNKNRMYLLERLENYQNNEKVMIDDNPKITIEHIFPQNPDPKWKLMLGDQVYQRIKETYLNTIANLTLSGNNGALSNKPFQEKRDMNIKGRKQGYKFSRLWLNEYLAFLDKWDTDELETRFDLIAERFLHIWKYPDVNIEDDYDYDEVNIFDADDPTHKRLAYVIFFGQKLPITRVSELYIHVIKTLFENQPETFFVTDLAEKTGLTKDQESLRNVGSINETYYIETNYDSATKFDRIKYALSLCNADEDLSIKYVD